ncbi:host attachment protein [Azospirillum soli]|uniref:baeRF12 domain-containing protein n=1 Tax=Azospirillum soli TaxID=1304799 RepID=UPI001AEACE13|nr:host attachment protein [Azospirillum soli]MBP2312708.1 hypothetical protein [Azospirillum soli]
MRRHAKIWFVLADGSKARVLLHRVGEPRLFEEIACASASPLETGTGIADLINEAAAHGLFDGLVLVAPQRTLSGLRHALLSPAGERLIHGEPKDLMGLPGPLLAARLSALLRRHTALSRVRM